MEAIEKAARDLMALYPRIYFACHTRHVRDPHSQKLLSRHQASILDHLDEIDPTTLNDLSKHMGVTPGTMSMSMDRLERKGYVMRLRDTADRRRVHLRLTSAGLRMREANSVLDQPRVEALIAHLSDHDRVAAIRGLALLAGAASEVARGGHGPESRSTESRGPESRGPESRGPESRGNEGSEPDGTEQDGHRNTGKRGKEGGRR